MDVNKTIIITGANGFIGSALVEHFSNKGYTIKAFVRNATAQLAPNISYHHYNLNEPVDEKQFENVDYLIHCAYIKNETAVNIMGTEHLLELGRKYKLKKIIYLSSMSALPDALSKYGKQKYALQQLFVNVNEAVVRPGLVIGNGGLYKEIEIFIRNNKLIPLLGDRKQPVQTVFISELVNAIEIIINKNLHGTFTIASPIAITIKALYNYIAKKLNKRVIYFSIPIGVIHLFVSLMNLLGLKKFPVSRESLMGLKRLRFQETKNDLLKLSIELTPLI